MAKYVSITEALSLVKSGDYIVTGLGCAEGREFMTNLHTIAGDVKNVMVSNCLPMGAYEFMVNPAYKESFRTEGWFYTPVLRKAHANGNISFIYNHLHLASFKRLCYRKPDIYVGIASMPDKHGYVSLSTSNTYEMAMIKEAKTVILEINPNAPRTFGDVQLHLNNVDYVVECDYALPEIADAEPNEKDLIIGKTIAGMINDGDCIQLGIGGIPNAVAASLMDKKDLGVHTEMLTSGMVKLAKAGVI
ncbi:MAG: 4-hydroxybutyrate--acetyl-CoA CoA transferase, partial [Clostridia bacterium]|nr:4-hydroxybutyrate--acetyl-CoA CoA transferase [Clostridia bacterium]